MISIETELIKYIVKKENTNIIGKNKKFSITTNSKNRNKKKINKAVVVANLAL
jgi:hypothetical protein